ncbi:PTS transporter subunit IIC [Klebsiella pneumoniae]|uniref:PTS transporter subunit IIC n=1 Tax=Klebsiella pneumoniae TaxID=573 RepID=UPI0038901FDB
MNDIAHTLYNIVQYILGFGPTVMLPLVLFILALFFKVKPAKALRSSLTVGIGFVGIYAIFDILTSNVGPAAQAMVERTGINLPVVDLGWPPLSAITWGSPIAPFVIPLTILINVAMLALNKTRTVDVDMWNYWHFALAGTLVYYSSGSLFFGLLAAAIAAVVVLKLADWSAPLVQKYFGRKGSFADALFGGVLSGRSVGRQNHRPYPGLNRIHIDPETVQKKFGIFGEPMMVGTILGIFLGVIAGYDFKKYCCLASALAV